MAPETCITLGRVLRSQCHLGVQLPTLPIADQIDGSPDSHSLLAEARSREVVGGLEGFVDRDGSGTGFFGAPRSAAVQELARQVAEVYGHADEELRQAVHESFPAGMPGSVLLADLPAGREG